MAQGKKFLAFYLRHKQSLRETFSDIQSQIATTIFLF
jgi:hypothetical protein